MLLAVRNITSSWWYWSSWVNSALTRTATYISQSLSATVSVFVLSDLRWLQSVWVIQLLVAATPLTLWLRVLSHDDHPVLNLVAQEHEKDSSCPAHFRIAVPVVARKCFCAMLHSVVSVQTVPHLSPLSSACSCASRNCRSSSHCASSLSESSTSVLSTFA